ncbi:MAG TPA: STAS domain-containing protein [Oxalicibacterium sp.]|nr:STAS domain-containing protein [Oxalicibacterium sp.]
MYQPGPSLTFDTARPAMQAGLQAIAGGQKDIDFSGVTAVDSSAVSVALAWQRAARAQGLQLAFHNLPENFRSLITLYDVAELLGLERHHGSPHHH